MTKGAAAEAFATKGELKKSLATKVVAGLAEAATAKVKRTGIFTMPGLCRIKARMNPAAQAGKKEVVGKRRTVNATPAENIVRTPRAKCQCLTRWPVATALGRSGPHWAARQAEE